MSGLRALHIDLNVREINQHHRILINSSQRSLTQRFISDLFHLQTKELLWVWLKVFLFHRQLQHKQPQRSDPQPHLSSQVVSVRSHLLKWGRASWGKALFITSKWSSETYPHDSASQTWLHTSIFPSHTLKSSKSKHLITANSSHTDLTNTGTELIPRSKSKLYSA